ncbi:fibroblast growth factor receptor substrate 2-like [Corythoichthys intestinalis]|uniref:fibroblast growth factor receptor substrate 2-like n=1 Tax=Corythoichthys intestinalis TaxID=161448 RepID=UPI0025A64A64|nr:fibroblast growth factor receptor substrate 2-like [Corythoichthys intestinalis]XP_061813135.1 fibroblast growth factor receptor substrate 2-like [Nerophis lumbriciformis]
MGSSCSSCPDKELIADNHHSKFKVINVDDDGNELGAGVMELTDGELVLHTHRRDDVRWPYLCLRRYGYDSNLFSFESGRRCQTGQGIFAFKCARAEEIFNKLQEVMHSHSISVVEEAVMDAGHQGAALSPAALGYSAPNGVSRIPSAGDVPSQPSSRHPSVASARLPSVGEESTHPLLVAEESAPQAREDERGDAGGFRAHTYVNTEEPAPESPASPEARRPSTPPRAPSEPRVLLEPQGARFVLGPTPVQRRLREAGEGAGRTGAPPPASRCQRPPLPSPDPHNVNNSAQRRTALLDYENLPALPPVWEARKPGRDREEGGGPGTPSPPTPSPDGPPTPSLNGFGHEHSHNYVNTENVTSPLRPDTARRRSDGPSVFNFDLRRAGEAAKTLNYIEVEMDNGDGPGTPRTPASPPPPGTPTRRTELYALIDIERTAAMSNLQKARPRDDGTSRKTRHNSTELPSKSAA